MANSYSRNHRHYLRNPKGRKQALAAGMRSRAVPVDAWDDIPCNNAGKIGKLIDRMDGRFSDGEIIARITRKLNCDRSVVADRLRRHREFEAWQAARATA